jgi:hypothetical protein
MCSQAIDWLSKIEPLFAALPKNEKSEIQDFSLLWSYFEGTRLCCAARMKSIRNYVGSIDCEASYCRFNMVDYLIYLRNRYFADGKITQNYSDLHFENGTKEFKVVADKMLRGGCISKKDELIGCLAIIYRLRNNLFHGDKWHYQLQGQYINFKRANELLMALMS